jgi:hypothetical protein
MWGENNVNSHVWFRMQKKKSNYSKLEFKWWIYESRVNENFHKTHHNLNLERNHQFFSYSIYYGIRGCIKMVRIYENPKLPKGGLENSWFWQVMNLATLWVHALYIQASIENLSKESCSIWRDFPISYHMFN